MTNSLQSNACHMFLFMLLIIWPIHLQFVFPKLSKQGGCCQSSQILGFRDGCDFGLPRSVQALEDLDVEFLLFKGFSKADEMVDNMSEPLLYINNGPIFLHSEHLILLD